MAIFLVIVNGDLVWFKAQWGIRQGDPLCYLLWLWMCLVGGMDKGPMRGLVVGNDLVILILLHRKLMVEPNMIQELTSWDYYFLSVNQTTFSISREVDNGIYFLRNYTSNRKLLPV